MAMTAPIGRSHAPQRGAYTLWTPQLARSLRPSRPSSAGNVAAATERDALEEVEGLVDAASHLCHPVEPLAQEALDAALQRQPGDGARAAGSLQLHLHDPALEVDGGEHEVAAVCLHGRAHQVEQLVEGGAPARPLGVVDGGDSFCSSPNLALGSRRDLAGRPVVVSCSHTCSFASRKSRNPYHAHVQLVVLAAGHGRRFGGLKQLAPVGPKGEAIMDYTAVDALAAGFESVILVVREEVREELSSHVQRRWPGTLSVEAVVQGAVAGTAQAVASAGALVDGPFGVANADDLYGAAAMATLGSELAHVGGRAHMMVGYRLRRSVLTDAPVTRGICEVSPAGELVEIVEQTVARRGDGFSGRPVGAPESAATDLTGEEVVSMNLWGFAPSILGDLAGAIDAFDPTLAPHEPGKPAELLLPSVVGELLKAKRATVRATRTEDRVIGITRPDDLPLLREILAGERARN